MTSTPGKRAAFLAALPLRVALLLVLAVWAAGCTWSFREQKALAASEHFTIPWLLPLIIDGLATAMGAVAYAASLDGRPAVMARLGTLLAVCTSSASNGLYAWQRTNGDPATIAIAAGVPVVANIAFEVLLSEHRRQVLRRRGVPAPVAVPYPRLVRLALSPFRTVAQWRRLVLELTAPERDFEGARKASLEGPTETPAETAPETPARLSLGTSEDTHIPVSEDAFGDVHGGAPRPPVRARRRTASTASLSVVKDVPEDLVSAARAIAEEFLKDTGRLPGVRPYKERLKVGDPKATALRDQMNQEFAEVSLDDADSDGEEAQS